MPSRPDILSAPVSDLALRPAVTARVGITVRQGIQRMREKGLGCVIFVDDAGKPVGKFTERMLIAHLRSHDGGLDLPAPISSHWASVRRTDSVRSVIKVLRDRDLRFVFVVDDDGKVVGLTGQRGVCEFIADHFPRSVLTSRVGGKPAIRQREGA